MSKATLDDLLYQPLSEDRLLPEWYDHGPVIAKRVGDRSYEVWANGTFGAISPDGNRFKCSHSACEWLESRNIKDDDDLEDVLNNKAGWRTGASRWFELIVFRVVSRNGLDHMHEMYNGDDLHYEFNPEVFVDMINDAIARDTEDDPHFTTVEGHDCHPDAIECCGECLELNGYDVAEESE